MALVISNFFRFNLFGVYESLNKLGTWNKLFFAPLQSFGVLLGALVALFLLRRSRPLKFSFLGTQPRLSVLMGALPIVFFSIAGVANTAGTNPHLLGFVLGVALLAYAIFEEFGWRGYMEDELGSQKEVTRVLVVASCWYVWHLSFLTNFDLLSNAKFFGIMLLGSWGIGKIIRATHSVLAAACFHTLYNVFTIHEKDILLSNTLKFWYIGLCVVLWIVIVKVWERLQARKTPVTG